MVGIESDLMHPRAVRIHDVQQKYRLLLRPIVRHRLVLRPPFIEQDRLGRELARRGEHDSAVRQIVGAHVMAGRDVVVGKLDDELGRGIVLVDVPVRLCDGGIVLLRIQRQSQRKYQMSPIGRHVQIADVALALGQGRGDVHLGAGCIGLAADIHIAARGGGDQVQHIDVRCGLRRNAWRRRTLDVGEGIVGDAGSQCLAARHSGRMPARGAAASEHHEHG